jgi:serine/threonine protein kinase
MQLLYYDCPIEQLGKRYTLTRLLGSGGMADVYLAWDEIDHHEAAVKVIRPHVLNPKTLHRFLHEGTVVTSLNHQHIIRIYRDNNGKGVRQETFTNPTSSNICKVTYIVMEYVKGDDLKKQLVPGEVHSLDKVARIFKQLCSAVQYAHDQGVIHRDIKPANILFRKHPQQGDQVVLSDFGLALLTDDTLSVPGSGTPAYMALEQWRGKPEPASDIFSLGVVLYQLCTGQLPFQISELALPLQVSKRPTLLNPSLPPALDDVILRALSVDPRERFASASLFWKAIQSAVRDTPLSPIPPSSVVQAPMPSPFATQAPLVPFSVMQTPAPSRLAIQAPVVLSSAVQDTVPSVLTNQGYARKDAIATIPTQPPNRSPGRGKRAIIALILVLTTLLGLGSLAAFLIKPVAPTPSAIVTITPASQIREGTYVMQNVTGNVNLDNHPVTIYKFTSTKSAADTVNATGKKETWVGVAASGMLLFSSSHTTDYRLRKGTTFEISKTFTIVTDDDVIIPAKNATTGAEGQATVKAHMNKAGVDGNIAAGTIDRLCCATENDIHVKNDTFSGGMDPTVYTFLQDSDMTAVTNAHQAALKSEAQNDINKQMKAGEQPLGDINCADPQTTADARVGDQGPSKAVKTAEVTVTVTCNAQAYDPNDVKTIAQNEFQQEINKNAALGSGYVLAGNIVTQSPQILHTQSDGTITSFSVKASGLWYYQWTDALKNNLRNVIKGKSKTEAQNILNSYTGVDMTNHPKIDIRNSDTLPTDEKQIKIDVKVLSGLSEGNSQTPTPTSSTPTSTI